MNWLFEVVAHWVPLLPLPPGDLGSRDVMRGPVSEILLPPRAEDDSWA